MRDQYEMQAKDLSRPLIITEGKTDWKHLKHALKKLQETEKFKELDIRYLEYDYEFSDSKLETLLMQLSKVPNSNKIIGICDRVLVMNNGKIKGELSAEQMSQEAIMMMATEMEEKIEDRW